MILAFFFYLLKNFKARFDLSGVQMSAGAGNKPVFALLESHDS